MGRIFGTALSLCLLSIMFVTDARAQAVDNPTEKGTLQNWVSEQYDCELIKPMIGQSDNSPTRVGAILNGFYEDKKDGKFVAYRITRAQEVCTPDFAIADKLVSGEGTYETAGFRFAKSAGLSFNFQFANYVNLAKLDAGSRSGPIRRGRSEALFGAIKRPLSSSARGQQV